MYSNAPQEDKTVFFFGMLRPENRHFAGGTGGRRLFSELPSLAPADLQTAAKSQYIAVLQNMRTPGNSSTLTYFNRCWFVRKENPDFPKFSLTHPKNQQRTVPPVAKNHRSQSRLSPPAGHSAWTRPRSHPMSVGKYWKMLLTTNNNSISIIIIVIVIVIVIIMIWVHSNISLTWILRPIKGDDSPYIPY